MGAVLVALLTLSAPASAAFRYVPPAVDTGTGELRPGESAPAAAEEPEAGPAGGAHAADPAAGRSAEQPGGAPGPETWRVREGEMLRAALARWGGRAGVEVLFLTDRRYRLEAAAAFEGGFMDAVQALFRGLAHLPHPPVAARAEGEAALVVTHRLRGGAGEEKAR